MSVNISTQQLMAASSPDTVAAALEKENTTPKLLTRSYRKRLRPGQ